MSPDRGLLGRLPEGGSAGDLFGQTGMLAALAKALAERGLSTQMEVRLDEERGEKAPEGGRNLPANRRNGSRQKTVSRTAARWFWTFAAIGTAPSIRC